MVTLRPRIFMHLWKVEVYKNVQNAYNMLKCFKYYSTVVYSTSIVVIVFI